MRELGDQQLHLKGESTTEQGIEEPEPENGGPWQGRLASSSSLNLYLVYPLLLFY